MSITVNGLVFDEVGSHMWGHRVAENVYVTLRHTLYAEWWVADLRDRNNNCLNRVYSTATYKRPEDALEALWENAVNALNRATAVLESLERSRQSGKPTV